MDEVKTDDYELLPEEPVKPKMKGGRGLMNGETGKLYSKEHQPSSEAKILGKKKKKFEREQLRHLLDMPYRFKDNSQVQQQLVEAFGERVKKMSVGKLMGLMQAQKAILKGDTLAFSQLINQALGLPTQSTELTGKDGSALSMGNIIFIPADRLSDEQLEAYLNQTNGSSLANNTSLPELTGSLPEEEI